MKSMVLFVAVLALAGCGEVGRYQFTPTNEVDSLWRFDTKTGQIAKCLFGKEGVVTCSAPV
jgi:predicted small lipoprotein YifL